VARQRRGTQFDPQVVDVFIGQAAELFAGLDQASSWDAVIGAEPSLGVRLAPADVDAALEAIADFADVKSPYTIGHSRGVADLVGEAARVLGPQAGTLLVVTSPYHVYRTRLIFSDHLPASRILVVASREEPLPTRWWTDREAATNVALELGKLVFYSLGLSFT